MLTKCEHCGEDAVDDSEAQVVCSACGIVVEGIKWERSDYAPSSTSRFFTPYSRFGSKTQQTEKPTINLKYGSSTLDNLCHVYSIDATCKAEIASLFKRICSARHYRHREDAAITAACCLFVVQRKNKKSIPINTICQELQCTRGKFSYFLKFLKLWLSSSDLSYYLNETSSPPNSQLVDTADGNVPESLVSLIRMVCDKAEDGEKSTLMKKTTELVKLANSCWLLTGRSPRSVVVACSYLCWKSMHRSRKKASFPQFCSKFDIHEPMAKLRIPELRAFLLKLGQKIPSYNKNYVNEQNLLFHLDTILENSETLRNDLFPEAKTKEAIESTEYSTFRIPCKRPRRKEPQSPVKYDPDMNASEIEISDSEIESYIYSENKSKIIKLCESDSLNA